MHTDTRPRRLTRPDRTPIRTLVRRIDDWTLYAFNPQPPLRHRRDR
jgi:hypothetical protein